MHLQKQQGIRYGLSIAGIGFVFANLVLAVFITITGISKGFMDSLLFLYNEDMEHIYPIAGAILIVSGYCSGLIMNTLFRKRWPMLRTCMLGSLLILFFAAIASGVVISLSYAFPPHRNFEFDLLFIPILVVVGFGLIPSLLTGYLFGKYHEPPKQSDATLLNT